MGIYAGKLRYQRKDVAQKYYKRRTKGIKGVITNYLETRIIKKALSFVHKHLFMTTGYTHIRNVLDTPCGDGRLIPIYHKYGLNMSYADISNEMMAIAKDKAPNTPFYKMDLEKVELNQTYDLLMCIRLFHHLPIEIKQTVLNNLAKLSDKYIILTFSSASINSVRRKRRHKVKKQHLISYDDFSQLAKNSGLTIIKHYRLLPFVSETNVVVLKKII